MYRILRILYKIICYFKIEDNFQKLLKINKKYFLDKKKYKKEFIIDYFESLENEIARSYFFNSYKNKYPCKLIVFSDKKNILINYRFRKFYKSINASKFDYIFFSFEYLKFFLNYKKKDKIKKYLLNINDKRSILDFEYKNIRIGKDIYDEYLYRFKKKTLDIKDKELRNVFYDFIFTIDYWENYFRKHDVIGISLSHPNLRLTAIIGKIANKFFNIPVYSVTNSYVKKNTNLDNHEEWIKKELLQIPKKFSVLPDSEKKIAIEWSKKQLDRRFKGEVGVDMTYSKKSAFSNQKLDRTLNKSDKIKILICTHEFHDSPHAQGGLLFADFYEWLLYLGEKSVNSSYEWYIKNHPDADNWTKKIVNDFIKNYPSIKLVNENISFLQLKEEGLNFVFTCHGTVGHECPLLGIQVINADLNHPHIAYDFNWSPKNLDELNEIILNLNKLKLEINSDDIYEYYYVVKKLDMKDDLIFNSYTDAKKIEREENKNIVDIFLEQINGKKHREIIEKLSSLI